MMAMIEASGVAKSFVAANGAVRPVLRNVSLTVERGAFVAIVGTMGSGKSTLLGILAGLIGADDGRVIVDGEPVKGVRHDSAFVFQNYSLLPWLTALENVRLAVKAAGPTLTRPEQIARARRALEQVGLGNAVDRRPSQLSGGMRQRVAIARAFATSPSLLFLDEPFGALDALTRETLQQDLVRLCSVVERPVTTVMITNSVEEAILLSDWIVPMLPGPPATLGTPIRVQLSRPRSLAQLAHQEDATHVRAHVIATLTETVSGRSRRSAAKPNVSPIAAHTLAAEEPR
jgi:nitrate/nitrite transport system ATP-binding protein